MSAFGDIINALGEFGLFQKWLVVLLSLPIFLTAFHMLGQLFMLVDVPHYCNTSWIRVVGPNLTEDEQLNLTVPRGASGAYEQCSMYSPVDWDLDSIVAYGLNATQKCSNGWVYPSTQTPSLLTEFDLVCDRKDLNDISQAIYMLGLLLGAIIFGPLSDRALSKGCTLFGSGETIHNDDPQSLFFSATEWVGVSYRTHAVLISHCCFAAGQMLLAGLSYGIRNWRLLEIAGSVPTFALFFYFWVLPESARWLMTKGRVEEAKKILQKAASVNKRTIPPGLLEQVPTAQWRTACSPERLAPALGFLNTACLSWISKGPGKMDFLIQNRFVNSLVYYGLSLNVTNFGLDIYLTQLAFGAVEVPARASCILFLQWFGRKKSQGVLLLLAGLVCLIITGIPEDLPVLITVLAVIGKFASSASFSTSYVYTAELFPTTGVGLCSMSARVAGIIAPLIRLLGHYHRAVPMAIFGSAPVVGGLLCFLLPETRGTELADDTARQSEAVNLRKKKKF
uniref:Solute carrier family 22 member 13-like n=1 Tax=Dromaius novaehollandiae TaxID=8790 RepID=A0A8C4KMT6_DRONO